MSLLCGTHTRVPLLPMILLSLCLYMFIPNLFEVVVRTVLHEICLVYSLTWRKNSKPSIAAISIFRSEFSF